MIYCMKKILIISNNCLSQEGSNGRTIDNIIHGWRSDKVAQFYIQDAYPDSSICENYFRVTDIDALKSIWQGQKGNVIKQSKQKGGIASIATRRKKNTFRKLLRELVWRIRRWEGKKFHNWLASFNPDVVFFQVGDNSFMIKIALGVADKFDIPLLVFNSEGYYFQNEPNINDSNIFSKILYSFFIKDYRKNFEKMMSSTTHVLYLSSVLQDIYSKHFTTNSSVIYTPSGVKTYPFKTNLSKSKLVFSYIGNVSHNRYVPLIEVAENLHLLNNNLKLNVYGHIPNKKAKFALLSCNAINYKGTIPYYQVKEVIKNSDILIHVESSDPQLKEVLKFGFSTKIADSLMSGRLFLLYAPAYVACSKYMLKELPGIVATNSTELDALLRRVLLDSQFRHEHILKAVELANMNHSITRNNEIFFNIINSL